MPNFRPLLATFLPLSLDPSRLARPSWPNPKFVRATSPEPFQSTLTLLPSGQTLDSIDLNPHRWLLKETSPLALLPTPVVTVVVHPASDLVHYGC